MQLDVPSSVGIRLMGVKTVVEMRSIRVMFDSVMFDNTRGLVTHGGSMPHPILYFRG